MRLKSEIFCHEFCNSMVSPVKKFLHPCDITEETHILHILLYYIYCKLELAGHSNGFLIIRNSFQVPGLYKSTATIDEIVPISATV